MVLVHVPVMTAVAVSVGVTVEEAVYDSVAECVTVGVLVCE